MSEASVSIGVTRWQDMRSEQIEPYWQRVREASAEVIDLVGPQGSVAGLDGLILTGGLDVVPERYGESPHPKVKRTDDARDAFELALLHDALAADLPVLAICRGHQLLNAALGGRLLQHIDSGEHDAHRKVEGVPSRWHSVRLAAGSRLRALLGADEIEVNSRHHQAVLPETLAPGLEPVALSPDGLVEAVESRERRWLIGVQWHPELAEANHRGFADRSDLLFRALVAEARRVREPV